MSGPFLLFCELFDIIDGELAKHDLLGGNLWKQSLSREPGPARYQFFDLPISPLSIHNLRDTRIGDANLLGDVALGFASLTQPKLNFNRIDHWNLGC